MDLGDRRSVWQNVLNTFIVASDNRCLETVDDVWKKGLLNATIISDRWASQLNGYLVFDDLSAVLLIKLKNATCSLGNVILVS